MSRPIALLLVAVVFAVGLVSGALGARLLDGRRPADMPGEPPHLERYFLHRDLDLTPEQRSRLEAIFRDSRRELEAVREELRPRVETVLERAHAEVEAVLDAEQLEIYRERRRRWRERGPGRHRGPRGRHRRGDGRDDDRAGEHPRHRPQGHSPPPAEDEIP